MIVVRRVGAVVLAAAALAVYFFLGPKSAHIAPADSHSAAVASVQSDFSTSDAAAQYVYGQIYSADVANKDMLAVLVNQQDDIAAAQAKAEQAAIDHSVDKRIPAELVVLILGAALFMMTSTSGAPKRARADTTQEMNPAEPVSMPGTLG